MQIIAFGYQPRVGKDTATRFAMSYLRANYPNFKVQRVSLAAPIKQIAYEMFSWADLGTPTYYENYPEQKDLILPKIGKTPRDVFVELGAAACNISERTLPEMCFQNLDCDIAVISDLRRPYEINFIRMFDAIAIKIERNVPEVTNKVDGLLKNYQDWDYVIENDLTLRDFNAHVTEIVKEFME